MRAHEGKTQESTAEPRRAEGGPLKSVIRRTCFALALAASAAHAQTDTFNRFTEELPRLLETDAGTVMADGLAYEIAATVCARLGNRTADALRTEVAAWRARNDAYFRAAASVLNEFGDRVASAGGEAERRGYMQMVLRVTAREASQRVRREFHGADPDNAVVPPERDCADTAHHLRQGAADFKRTPEITRALVPYMQRKAIH